MLVDEAELGDGADGGDGDDGGGRDGDGGVVDGLVGDVGGEGVGPVVAAAPPGDSVLLGDVLVHSPGAAAFDAAEGVDVAKG